MLATGTPNKDVVRQFVERYQVENDQDAFEEILSPDLVDHSPMPGIAPGRDGVHMLFDAFHAAFEGFRAEIYDQVAEGDRVVTRKAFFGRHVGPFMGMPATEKDVRIDVIDIVRVREGRIVEHWNIVDQLSLLRQLGAIPEAG